MTEGEITDWYTVIGGLSVPTALTPTGSYYRVSLNMKKSQLCGGADCSGYGPCGVRWSLGGEEGEILDDGSGWFYVNLQAGPVAPESFPFSFEFCNFTPILGCACGVFGCADHRIALHTPAPVVPRNVPPGDGPLIDFGSADIALDFATGSGGIATAVTVAAAPPHEWPGTTTMQRYWEVGTTSQGYEVDVLISYDEAELPAGVSENELIVFAYLPSDGWWMPVSTAIDTLTNTATASSMTELSALALAPASAVGVEQVVGPAVVLGTVSPNPLTSDSVIPYHLSTSGRVELTLYDVAGRRLRHSVTPHQTRGHHRVRLDGLDFTSGVYYFELRAGDERRRGRFAVVK